MILRRDEMAVGEARTTADGGYRFANLPAGVYALEAVGLGEVASGVVLDGERELVADVLWPGSGPRSVLQGRVLDAQGEPVPDALVRLLRDGAEAARTQTDQTGGFRFSGLAGGLYALAIGEEAPLVMNIVLDEDATLIRDVVLPPAPARLLSHYLLFGSPPAIGAPGRAEAELLLGLALRGLARSGASAGYSVRDAAQAEKVTIIGDGVAADAEQALATAGCRVERLSGDAYAIAAGLERLFAEGANG
jgi:hypothetical protein